MLKLYNGLRGNLEKCVYTELHGRMQERHGTVETRLGRVEGGRRNYEQKIRFRCNKEDAATY
jgi:hypothetical protein